MDELIKIVSQKAGISEAQAQQAVQAVMDFLKERLPGPIATQIDSILASPGLAKGIGDVAQGLGGMLGRR